MLSQCTQQWTTRLAAAFAVLGLSAAAAASAAAQTAAGEAYGAYVQTPEASQAKSPLAVLPSVGPGSGDMAEASGEALSVLGAFSSDLLTSVTSGAVGAGTAGAQSVATVAEVTILSGLITASRVFAVTSTSRSGSTTISNAYGSTFENLRVSGVSIADNVAPNTRISLPGVGYVVLNEQVQHATGITVNMIHVVLQTVTGGECTSLECLPEVTATVGEIIVGSASSSVR